AHGSCAHSRGSEAAVAGRYSSALPQPAHSARATPASSPPRTAVAPQTRHAALPRRASALHEVTTASSRLCSSPGSNRRRAPAAAATPTSYLTATVTVTRSLDLPEHSDHSA